MATIDRIDPKVEARQRVTKAIERLPSYWKAMFLERYPQYNTRKGKELLLFVSQLNNTDMRITRLLEQLADDWENMELHRSTN